MNPTVTEAKQALRRAMRAVQARVSAEVRAAASAALCQRMGQQPLWQQAERVLFFAPLPQEPDLRPLLAEALRAGKTVVLPRFDPERRDYGGFQIRGLSDLQAGHFGIEEPGPHCPAVPLNRLDFLFVPGVAFDASGRRLGRGKGYFDRLLADARGHKCGVAFEWQVVARVPTEPHDAIMDSLLTPKRWLRCAG